jgi:queuine/archaeosine tRNA-ribosyltransferase
VRAAIEQIASISAEGSLMADDLARGRTKTTYVRVHGEELSAQAEHEAEKLNDAPVDPALHDRIQKALGLSSEIGGAIDDMRVSPQDRQKARQSQQDLQKWADEARKLADSI